MKFLSLEPFVPSGKDLENAKQLFVEIGFRIAWDAGDYIGFEKDNCKFILQHYDDEKFAQNLMISVKVDNAEEFRTSMLKKQLPTRFGIRIGEVTNQPYGKEVNLIDMAGVCWHFVE
jgi:hypothetical protein